MSDLPEQIGRYKILEEIGRGGMGLVYKAKDPNIGRLVALKVIKLSFDADDAMTEEMHERFAREARAAGILHHPNIVTIFEVSEYNNRPFFAMEYINGQSLKIIIEQKKLTSEEAINFTIQICEGLGKAHEANIVHRDIKPSNIMIGIDNRLKILDFGLATVKGSDKITQTGSTMGTFGYMSPEQIQGKGADHRSDLFSLGVVFFEMLTFAKPFRGENEATLSHAIIYDTADPLNKYSNDIPSGCQRVVDKMLEKDPEKRFENATDILLDLKPCLLQMLYVFA